MRTKRMRLRHKTRVMRMEMAAVSSHSTQQKWQRRPTLFLNSPRRAPSLGQRASIPLLCPTAPPEASFLGVGRQRLVRWRWRQSLTQPVHRSSYQREGGQVEGTKNTSAKRSSVCFSKLHAAPLFATGFGQLTISHIKQQAPSLQLRTEC